MIMELADSIHAIEQVSSTIEDIERAMSGADPAIHALLAETDKRPVGVAVFFLSYSTWRGTQGVYVQDIYVAASARGTGLGKRLLAAVVSWAGDRGADHLRLSVDRDNTEARSFYDNIGLSYCEEEMIYKVVGKSFEDLASGR